MKAIKFLSILGSSRGLQHGTPIPHTVKSAWHLAVYLVGTGDINLVILVLAGQTNSATTLFVPAKLWRQAVMQGHGGAMWQPELAMQ